MAVNHFYSCSDSIARRTVKNFLIDCASNVIYKINFFFFLKIRLSLLFTGIMYTNRWGRPLNILLPLCPTGRPIYLANDRFRFLEWLSPHDVLISKQVILHHQVHSILKSFEHFFFLYLYLILALNTERTNLILYLFIFLNITWTK